MSSMFNKFTNLYNLSKTLRFELKPVGNTEKMLEEDKVFENDRKRKESYIKTKPYLDELHRAFIKESLDGKTLNSLEKYFEVFKKYQKDRKDKDVQKALDSMKKELRKEIKNYFNLKAVEWSTERYPNLKKVEDVDKLLSEEQVFTILKKLYGDNQDALITDSETGKESSIFDNWKGFTGYFIKFFETRKNFYKDDGTSTAIATRIVDQNLDRFLSNLILWEEQIKDLIDITGVEEFFGLSSENIFNPNFYSTCMLQDGIDRYNDFLGGKTLDSGEKQKGINEIINEYRQKNKGERIPFLKKLDKQILSEKDPFIDEIESEEELFHRLKVFYESAREKTDILKKLTDDFFTNQEKYDLKNIYISKAAYNTISRMWTNNTDKWNDSLYSVLKEEKLLRSTQNKEEILEKFKDFISLEHIKKSLDFLDGKEKFWKDRYYDEGILVEGEEVNLWQGFLKVFQYEFSSLFNRRVLSKDTNSSEFVQEGYGRFSEELEKLLKDFKVNRETKVIIKNFSDEVLRIYQMSKYFALEKDRKWNEEYILDSEFYNHPIYGYKDKYYEDTYESIVKAYNKIRNFLTKKPYSENKWKLNFDNPTLADGWDKNKEVENATVILRKDGEYYLAIMRKGSNRLFADKNKESFKARVGSDFYEKLAYKYLPDPSKMIPKCTTQMNEVKAYFEENVEDYSLFGDNFVSPLPVSKRIFDLNNVLYNKANITETTTDKKEGVKLFQKEYLSISKDSKIYKSALKDWIDFCKDFLSKYESIRNFDYSNLKKSEEYEDLSQFYTDVASFSYKIWFEEIDTDYIHSNNQSGKLYLFQIYNKDFSKKSKGMKNLHTMYFEEVFSQNNIDKNFPVKLNGQAELFYRPATDKTKLGIKKDSKGKEVVDRKRYSENKIFFHVPITLNRLASNTSSESAFNKEFNNFLVNNPDVNIIGLDRGEKHLIYFSVINQAGNIIESGSFNKVGGVDYHTKLSERAEARKRERQDWNEVETIKDLKRGYLSQVIKRIVDLCIEHNAIIVMEDLNFRFKQIRGGIEKSVYQQLEKALIEKLNYLVDKKEMNPSKAGHLLNAYQLTAPFDTFKKMGKQTGVIFYTQAAYTSQIDPLSGWRKNIYLKYSNANKAKEDILRFNNIEYNKDKNRFEFTYDIKQFVGKKDTKNMPSRTKWTLCSNVERFRWDKSKNSNKGDYVHYEDITENLIELFSEYQIDYTVDIKKQIIEALESKGNERFFKNLIYYFNLICQIRNTQQDKEGDENDFILSPVEPFFDSRRAQDFTSSNKETLPRNGDENGAYNIARKGILILNKINTFYNKNQGLEKLGWNDLSISNKDWDDFATDVL